MQTANRAVKGHGDQAHGRMGSQENNTTVVLQWKQMEQKELEPVKDLGDLKQDISGIQMFESSAPTSFWYLFSSAGIEVCDLQSRTGLIYTWVSTHKCPGFE